MFLSKQEKILFFHIPKTAGTSIRDFLLSECSDGKFINSLIFELFCKHNKNYRYNHRDQYFKTPAFNHLTQTEAKIILETLNLHLENFTEIVVVRNPYHRLQSYYNFVLHKHYDNIHQLLDDIETNTVDPKLYFTHQLDYIKNSLTKNLKIFKYERFYECEEFLQTKLKTTKKLPNLNISKQQVIDELTIDVKRRISDIFREEFEVLGYEICV